MSEYFELEENKNDFVFESLKLYILAEQYKVLPVSGGIYEQDPRLLMEWAIISKQVALVKQDEIEAIKDRANTTNGANFGKYPARKVKSYDTGSVGGLQFKRVPQVPGTFQRYYKQPKSNK